MTNECRAGDLRSALGLATIRRRPSYLASIRFLSLTEDAEFPRRGSKVTGIANC